MGNDLLSQIKAKVQSNTIPVGDAEAGKNIVAGGGATPKKSTGFLSESEIRTFQSTVEEEKRAMSKYSKFRKFVLDSNPYMVPVYDAEKMKEFRARNAGSPNLRALVQQAQAEGQFGEPVLKERGGKKFIGVLFDRPKLKAWDGVDPNTIEYELSLMKSKDFLAFMATRTKFILGGDLNDSTGIRLDIKKTVRKGVPKFINNLVLRDGETQPTDPAVSIPGKIYKLNADGTRVVDEEKSSTNEETGYKTFRYVYDWNPEQPLIAEVFERKAGGSKKKKKIEGGTLAEHDVLENSELLLQEYISSMSHL